MLTIKLHGYVMGWNGTFSKAGGGFFPLQRLERAQTAFLVIVNLVDLVRSLKWQRKANLSKSDHIRILLLVEKLKEEIRQEKSELTLTVVEGYYSSAHSPCKLHCPQQYYLRPTQPAENETLAQCRTKQAHNVTHHSSHTVCYLFLDVLKIGVE